MDEGEELELGSAGGNDEMDRQGIAEIKYTDREFSSVQWCRYRYLATLIGKSARAVAGSYEYTRPDGNSGGLGHRVEGLEGDVDD